MSRETLKSPINQTLLLALGAYLFFKYGIALISKPIPSSLISQYMGITMGVILLYMAADENRWLAFKQPIFKTLTADSPGFRWTRLLLFIALPIFAGYQTYLRVRPRTSPPTPFRTIHPANPSTINVKGHTYDLTTLTNPLRANPDEYSQHLAVGKQVYYERCFYCHGDTWEGDGHFARGFVPAPAKFTGDGTLAILTESYVFWRIAKGGPGLPREATPWNSAMPAWEDRLTDDEMWAVSMYLYDAIGKEPRTQGAHGGEEAH